MDRIIKLDEVVRITGLSASTIWRMEKTGFFPSRIQISQRSVGWSEADVEEWIQNLRLKRAKDLIRSKGDSK